MTVGWMLTWVPNSLLSPIYENKWGHFEEDPLGVKSQDWMLTRVTVMSSPTTVTIWKGVTIKACGLEKKKAGEHHYCWHEDTIATYRIVPASDRRIYDIWFWGFLAGPDHAHAAQESSGCCTETILSQALRGLLDTLWRKVKSSMKLPSHTCKRTKINTHKQQISEQFWEPPNLMQYIQTFISSNKNLYKKWLNTPPTKPKQLTWSKLQRHVGCPWGGHLLAG